MTFGNFIKECENWEYSQEAYELKKDCMKLELMEQYLENHRFAMECAEYGETFTEGFLMESADIDTINSITENTETKKENIVIRFIKLITKPFITFFKFLKKLLLTWKMKSDNFTMVQQIYLHAQEGFDFDENDNPKFKFLPNMYTEEVDDKGNIIVTNVNTKQTVVISAARINEYKNIEQINVSNIKLISNLEKCLQNSDLSKLGVSLSENQPKSKEFTKFLINSSKQKINNASNTLRTFIYCAMANAVIKLEVKKETSVMNYDQLISICNQILEFAKKGESNNSSDWSTIQRNIEKAQNNIINDGLLIDFTDDGIKNEADNIQIAIDNMNEIDNIINNSKNNIDNNTTGVSILEAISKSIHKFITNTMKVYAGINNYRKEAYETIVNYLNSTAT